MHDVIVGILLGSACYFAGAVTTILLIRRLG
jgi:hypothetical protein